MSQRLRQRITAPTYCRYPGSQDITKTEARATIRRQTPKPTSGDDAMNDRKQQPNTAAQKIMRSHLFCNWINGVQRWQWLIDSLHASSESWAQSAPHAANRGNDPAGLLDIYKSLNDELQ
ncbi:MAG: hypothetical protein U0892_00170 [Pirellulales bacterium]